MVLPVFVPFVIAMVFVECSAVYMAYSFAHHLSSERDSIDELMDRITVLEMRQDISDLKQNRVKQPAAGIWHSIDEAPPENETLLVKLQWDDKSTGVYVATKYNENHDWCSPGWQIHPDDEDQLRDDCDEYPIIEWACIQKQDNEK